jgi:putative hemolysin
MTQIARISDTGNERRLQAERLVGAEALQQAQALRFNVFSGEFNAKLKGAEHGLDMDDYDVHCSHIGVRDLNSGRLVATTRLLDHAAASTLGRFYSEEEFSLHGLLHLQGPILEIGRTCVDPAYRNGGGIQAHAIMQRLRERYLCNEHLRAEPKKPLPALDLPSNVIAEMPPLLKAYMRLGAKICGEPCWDEDFQVADVFILLKRDELCPRYARHFKAAM